MILLIRILPLCIAALEAALFWWQTQMPGSYPWIVVAGVALLPAAALAISWKQVRLWDLMEKMAPTFLLILSLGFALLLVEGVWPTRILIALVAAAAFLSLEVLFLLARHPTAYPVHGISRVNIAYVPLTVWYAFSTSIGMIIFLQTDRLWHIVMSAVLGVLIFRTTGHPGATKEQNRVWMMVGGIVGLETGLLGLLLPVSMAVQGLIAVLLICGTLRARRYLHDPKPSPRTAFIEGGALILLLATALVTAKWI